MTLHVADIALYQGELTPDALAAAGFTGVNIKTSHGLTQRTVHPQAARWVTDARQRGWGVCTFHWLDASAPGTDQARYAHEQLRRIGLNQSPFGHVVDVEAGFGSVGGIPTEQHYADYVTTMTGLLGRPITTYTGDWWWLLRGWAPRTPWLWSAPAAGSQPAYPGDTSEHWAGYGGWDYLAAMQWNVLTVGGIRVSATAIRSADVWAAMTGDTMASWVVVPALEALRHELNETFPHRDRSSDGGVGDTSHGARPSGHNPDETGVPEDHDADDVNEVRARDFDSDLSHPAVDMEDVCQYLLAGCRAGRITWIKYLIYNRRIWSASTGWVERAYTGANPHDKHLHVSCRPETSCENDTRPVGLATLLEEDMPTIDEVRAVVRAEVMAAVDDIVKGVWDHRLDIDVSSTGVNMQAAGSILRYTSSEHGRIDTGVRALAARLGVMDDREAAEVPPGSAENAAAVVDAIRGASDEVTAALLRTVLGDRAADVGRLLAGQQA